jgi:hypothetical protein
VENADQSYHWVPNAHWLFICLISKRARLGGIDKHVSQRAQQLRYFALLPCIAISLQLENPARDFLAGTI